MNGRAGVAETGDASPGADELPPTPCVGVCVMGADGYCEGCLRTLDEIARWGGMDRAERAAVYAELRRRAGTHGLEPTTGYRPGSRDR